MHCDENLKQLQLGLSSLIYSKSLDLIFDSFEADQKKPQNQIQNLPKKFIEPCWKMSDISKTHLVKKKSSILIS